MSSPTSTSPGAFRTARELLVSDPRVGGGEFRRVLGELTDGWLTRLFDDALTARGLDTPGIALVALGGYGRAELCPGSDLDLMIVHHHRGADAATIADAVWYPVWDTGLQLGHSVREVSEAVALVGDDIETSTALLDARFLAGDASIVSKLAESVTRRWTESIGQSTDWLRADADARRAGFSDVAFAVEPNVKAASGGLRDAQIPFWIDIDGSLVEPADREMLSAAKTWLLDVRVALHRCGGATSDVLRLEDQDEVAALVGAEDADQLMTRVAGAARDVSWVLDECWARIEATRAASGRHRIRRNRRSETASDVDDSLDVSDPVAVLQMASATAGDGKRLARQTLAHLASDMPAPDHPWTEATRRAFIDLLSLGHRAIPVIESLDHVGVWERFVPEWPAVRNRAQRTTHHRFTVDRHLLETIANAAGLADRVSRPDLLIAGALLHDIGKGRGGDHAKIGVDLAREIMPRMGFGAEDGAIVEALVEFHLLLPEVATRRDIADPATIDTVARAVGSTDVLDLLSALTEADARATGPNAWTDWKVGLITTLTQRVSAYLGGADLESVGRGFPSPEQSELLRAGETIVRGDGRTLTVVAPDRPRLFCRVTGALVLAGLNVIAAEVTSANGMALEVFTVAPAFASSSMADTISIDWDRVTVEVEQAMAGRVAIAARVAERADTYRRRLHSADAAVRIHYDDADPSATVVEVDAPDAVGRLFAITRALADLDVDIRYARVETQTDRVVDAFSIVDSTGAPIIDPAFRAEIERALRHAVGG